MESLAKSKTQILEALPDEFKGMVEKRLSEMERLTKISRTLERDKWNDNYTEGFAKHIIGIREAGITDRFSQSLTQKTSNTKSSSHVIVLDENGKPFDSLRASKAGEKDSIIYDLSQYIDKNGGSYEQVSKWMMGQAGSSSSGVSQALKMYYQGQRKKSRQDYYWSESGINAAENFYDKIVGPLGESKMNATYQAWHAFNYEMLDKINFPGKNKAKNTVELIRIENKEVMKMNGLKIGDKNVQIKRRAVFESTSLFSSIHVFGSEKTVQQVPLHRIIGTYWTAKNPTSNGTGFAGDDENEFVAMLDGIPLNYVQKSN
jgi:hypothetical protein